MKKRCGLVSLRASSIFTQNLSKSLLFGGRFGVLQSKCDCPGWLLACHYGGLREHNLTRREAEAAWTITPSGNRYRGAGAINLALSVALSSRVPIILYRLPFLRQLQDAAYATIARNRHRFRGVTPYCHKHPEARV